MAHGQPYKKYDAFIFEDSQFDFSSRTATFRYSFDSQRFFEEKVSFSSAINKVNPDVLQAAIDMAFLLVGISYYKTFPTKNVELQSGSLDKGQAAFATATYRNGLGQFLYENNLTPAILPVFKSGEAERNDYAYKGKGILALQSGGKDSLLTAASLETAKIPYVPWYMPYGAHHPAVLDRLAYPLRTIKRQIDMPALQQAQADGGLNGHVPITYIVMSLALIDMILNGEKTMLVSIGAEGEEPHTYIGDLPINHQWAKTWDAERQFAWYVQRYISPDIQVGSPLRNCSELRISELFARYAWPRFGHEFSSCNLANYAQGSDNRRLAWDGTCPKCANAFLLFAPFVEPSELAGTIGGNLLAKPELVDTYKGLLGIDSYMKPFECVGETEELRLAYHMARQRWGVQTYTLPFDVPLSDFGYKVDHNMQEWARSFLSTSDIIDGND